MYIIFKVFIGLPSCAYGGSFKPFASWIQHLEAKSLKEKDFYATVKNE